jgi:hypothetical protein
MFFFVWLIPHLFHVSFFVYDLEIANEMDFQWASVNESATDVCVSPSCVFYLYSPFYSFCGLCYCAQNQVTMATDRVFHL